MENKPLISIITCTYNSEKYLPKMLDSVKNQKFRNFEHIFVDAYSTDNTLKLIEKYDKQNKDIKVRLIKRKPNGISSAMNNGIKNARGKIIQFLHSDDYYYSPSTLLEISNLFHEKSANWIIGNDITQTKGKIKIISNSKCRSILKKILIFAEDCISHPNTFMNKIIFQKYGLFDETFKVSMDYEYWLRIIRYETPYYVNKNFTIFRIHGRGMSSNKENLHIK